MPNAGAFAPAPKSSLSTVQLQLRYLRDGSLILSPTLISDAIPAFNSRAYFAGFMLEYRGNLAQYAASLSLGACGGSVFIV